MRAKLSRGISHKVEKRMAEVLSTIEDQGSSIQDCSVFNVCVCVGGGGGYVEGSSDTLQLGLGNLLNNLPVILE